MKKTIRVVALFCVTAMLLTTFAFAENTKGVQQSFVEDFSEKDFLGATLSEYTIVLGSDATAGIKHTLNCFIQYIKDATGSELKIASEGESFDYEICIGKTDRESEKLTAALENVGEGGIALVSDGSKIFLTGDGQLGVIYSMYEFLEVYLGYRFYAPDFRVAKHEYASEFPSDLNYTYTPDISTRDTDFRDVFSGDVVPYSGQFDPEFSNSLRINGPSRDFHNSQHNLAQYGGQVIVYAGGPSYGGHTFGRLSEMAAGLEVVPQPCLADEEVYQTMLKNVRKLLAATPNATVVDVSQNDGADFCRCEKCNALDMQYSPDGVSPVPAASILTLVNRIARDIKDDYPNVLVCTLAYGYSTYPPIGMVAEDNVAIRLCNIECCFAHSLGDESCTYGNGLNSQFAQNIKEWGKISKNLYIYDYAFNAHYMYTYPNFDSLYDNIRLYRDNNAIFVHEQGTNASHDTEFSRLRSYIIAKLMWNPDMTKAEYDNMIEEYLRDYYGAGWKYIKRYVDLVTESAKRYHMGIYTHPHQFIRTLSNTDKDNEEFYSELVNLWNKAYNRAETDIQKTHVRFGRTQAEFLYLEKFYNAETDMERADELYCDMIAMGARCIQENYHYHFPRRWKFIQGPQYWYEY